MNSRVARLFLLPLALAILGRAVGQPATPPPPVFPLEAYADLGAYFGENNKFYYLNWTDEQFESFLSGMRDSFHGKAHNFKAGAQALRDEVNRHHQQVAQAE